jgi:uncharacterized protein YukE
MTGQADHGKDKTWGEMHHLTRDQRDRRNKITDTKHDNRRDALHKKINWDVYQHDQLYDMIMSADLEAMSHRSAEWRGLAGDIASTTGEVQRIVGDLMHDWQGMAAISAADYHTRLTQWAGDASHTATQIAAGMADYTDAVEHAQRTMPKPAFDGALHNFKAGYSVVGTGGPSTAILLRTLLQDQRVSHEKAVQDKAEAVRVMTTYEDRSRDVHDSLPRFSGTTATLPDQPAAFTPTHTTNPGNPNPNKPDPNIPNPDNPNLDDPNSNQLASANPNQTSAAGFVTPDAGASGPYGDGTTGGFGAGGSGIPGSGTGSGRGADLARGGSAGLGAGASSATELAARGFGTPGTPGAAGMGGLYPPMAGTRAGGEDDGEHTNKYDDGLDLFDDLPPAYPPVFGA